MDEHGRDRAGPHDPEAVRPSVDEADLDVECWWCRAVVAYLAENDGVASPDALATAIAATRGDVPLDDIDPEPARKRLVSRHLPALSNAGVVLWFETEEAETVVLDDDLLVKESEERGPTDHIDRE